MGWISWTLIALTTIFILALTGILDWIARNTLGRLSPTLWTSFGQKAVNFRDEAGNLIHRRADQAEAWFLTATHSLKRAWSRIRNR